MIKEDEVNKTDMSLMTMLDFLGDDIWLKPHRARSTVRDGVSVTVGSLKGKSDETKRVSFTFRGEAFEVAKKFKGAVVSSFEELKGSDKVFFKLFPEKERGTFALTTQGSSSSVYLQVVVKGRDSAVYSNKWHGGCYELKPLREGVFYIDFADRR
jgi:hypothetical protein